MFLALSHTNRSDIWRHMASQTTKGVLHCVSKKVHPFCFHYN